MHVEEGEHVVLGQTLFEDRSIPGVRHTAPGAGRVVAITRGSRRVLQSIAIELTPQDDEEHLVFDSWPGTTEDPSDDAVRALLVESGQWTALRTRPFGKVPPPDGRPAALFVTAIDTAPLAPDPAVIVEGRREDFVFGLRLLAKLTEGTTYVCVARGSSVALGLDAPVSVEEFTGPHPAGAAGTHIHRLAPVSRTRTVWHIGYQDVIAIGSLFRTGRVDVERVVGVAGPPVPHPRLVRTRVGASVDDLLAEDSVPMGVRVIAGSPLDGKSAAKEPFAFLGRYDNQVSVLREDRAREFLGWIMPGGKRFSLFPSFLSSLLPRRPLDMTTSTHGAPRPIIPNGQFERVMPMDLVPSYLLRALAVGDIERAEALGCLELIEEDLALCTFVDPGKNDFGPMLRKNLSLIEKDG